LGLSLKPSRPNPPPPVCLPTPDRAYFALFFPPVLLFLSPHPAGLERWHAVFCEWLLTRGFSVCGGPLPPFFSFSRSRCFFVISPSFSLSAAAHVQSPLANFLFSVHFTFSLVPPLPAGQRSLPLHSIILAAWDTLLITPLPPFGTS